MKAKSKYNTIEEKKQANRDAAKKWYYAHKDSEEFKKKRNEYHKKYYNNLDQVKKEALKAYISDYVFYIKNIKTGKFELKIARTKDQLKELTNKLNKMEERFIYLKNKFVRLETKNESNE